MVHSASISSPVDPHREYTKRLAARRAEAVQLAQQEERISVARLATFLIAVGGWWLFIRSALIAGEWLLAPVFVFVGLIVMHERARQASRLAARSIRFYEHGLARVEDRWSGQGETGEHFRTEAHPYADDLDVFGPGSLFQLLCTARTREGERTLANWLCASAAPEEIRARQSAIAELRPKLDLREQLALRGEDVRAAVHPEALTSWMQAPAVVGSLAPFRIGAAVMAVANVAALFCWLQLGMPVILFLATLGVAGVLTFYLRALVQQVVAHVASAGRELHVLAEVLSVFEQEQFSCAKLVALRSMLDTEGAPPSRQIARLRRLINLLESGKNQIFVPIAALLLWEVQLALAIEAWRLQIGPAVARWLSAIGELEALSALAGYAYEHPADPFPKVVTHAACFDGEELGHPLLPEARCVRNSVSLGESPQVLIVSGSNMSGKSTLLRTVGVNAVLALAGAPVRAQRLSLSPLAIGATLRIQDSLQEGSSRFYAEITRLSMLMRMAKGSTPLLFLLDEILHGTNSHDRQIGAEALVRGFLERGAIGLVTTHDLALARVAELLAPRGANVCFEDHFEGDKLVFDYRMRPGIVQKSNALALMRSVGLDV